MQGCREHAHKHSGNRHALKTCTWTVSDKHTCKHCFEQVIKVSQKAHSRWVGHSYGETQHAAVSQSVSQSQTQDHAQAVRCHAHSQGLQDAACWMKVKPKASSIVLPQTRCPVTHPHHHDTPSIPSGFGQFQQTLRHRRHAGSCTVTPSTPCAPPHPPLL